MAGGTTEFRVNLDVFRGPLDVLLYLIRKHELAITEISVSEIAEQFLQFVESAQPLDVDTAADYLAMASWLVELKSYELLPHGEEMPEEFASEPREELVRRLLEYKRYRDLAYLLEERAKEWQTRLRRLSDDLGESPIQPADEPLQEVHLWDLVQAFLRVLQESEVQAGTTLVYDDTPIQVFMERIYRRLLDCQQLAFRELFLPGMHKSTLVGIFMAVLELVRFGFIRVHQEELFGEILLSLREDRPPYHPWEPPPATEEGEMANGTTTGQASSQSGQ
jgi:segregation and condensation protein A